MNLKNILRWFVCALSVAVIIVCFVSIVNSIALAGRSDVSVQDKSDAISTVFASVAILMCMVGVFLVALIQLLQNDESKLNYASLIIGAIAFICLICSFVSAKDSLQYKVDTINAAKAHQRELESLDNLALVTRMHEEHIIGTIDVNTEAEFLALLADTERVIVYNSALFLDLLEEKGLLEKLGWKEDIWFETKNTELRTQILTLTSNLLIFSSAPIIYGVLGLIKKKEEFTIKRK